MEEPYALTYIRKDKKIPYTGCLPYLSKGATGCQWGGNLSSFKLGGWGIRGGNTAGIDLSSYPPFLPCDSDTKYISYLVRKLIS